ncbi:serine/threonine-protein kinase [Sorangium sp. So ce764]|uniref:serine/threonine-protein kinase n=1 Tax=Sorangium sp. So ce764 TaxID=3133320 RepID=UPI003F633CF6
MDAIIHPGTILLGKYRVERVLGRGGMGIVLAARHLDLGELFAIKLLLPEAMGTQVALDRFLREARASARLKGEHVAKVHDVGSLENGAPYMVMEFLDGMDLKQVVQAHGPLPVRDAVTYVLQASDAIAEAHVLGIVHRDLKPANLFLTRRPNGSPRVKVLDFGISRLVTPDGMDLTKTGSMLGSPLYMSPEQMMHAKQVDARSDIWAMGVVLYELVTGRVPFPADTLTEIVGRVLQDQAPPPSQLRPGVPPELDAVVARCLQKRPEHRFQRIEDLMAALEAVPTAPGPAAGAVRQSAASQPGFAAHSGALASGHVSQPALALPTSAPPAAAATGSSWGNVTAPSPPMKAHKVGILLSAVLSAMALAGGGVWLAWGSAGAGAEGATPRAPAASREAREAAPLPASQETREAAPLPAPSVATPPLDPPSGAAPVTTASAASAPSATTTLPRSVASPPAGRPASAAAPASAKPRASPAARAVASAPAAISAPQPPPSAKKYEGVF